MADGIPIIQGKDPLGGLRQFFTGFTGGALEQVRNQQLAQQLGGLFPGQNFQNITDPRALQLVGQLGLQQQAQGAISPDQFTLGPGQQRFAAGGQPIAGVKPTITPESESQFTAFLGRKIADGTATPQEETLFEQLTKVPEGTQIFTGEIAATTRAKLEQKVVELDDTIATLNDISANIEDVFQTTRGKLRAGGEAFAERVFGVKPATIEKGLADLGITKEADPEFLERFTTFQTTAFERLNAAIKEITGVAVKDSEVGRISKQTVDPQRDSPTQFRAKLNEVRRIAEAMRKRRLIVLARGKRPIKPELAKINLDDVDRIFEREIGSRQVVPEIQGPKPIRQMNEAELDREIKELEARINQQLPLPGSQPRIGIGGIRF